MNVKDISNLKTIHAFEDNFAVYETTDGKSGIINRQGNILFLADKYEYATYRGNGIFELSIFDGVYHQIRFNANTCETIHHHLIPTFTDYSIEIINEEHGFRCGICDKNYRLVVPIIYNGICEVAENRFMANKDGKWGLITATGEIVLPFQYDDYVTGNFTPEMSVSINGEYFLINMQGEQQTRNRYEYLEQFRNNGLAIIKKDGHWGLIDRNENIVFMTTITCEPTTLINDKCFYWCGENRLAFRQNGLLGMMDIYGNIITKPQFKRIALHYQRQSIQVKNANDQYGYISIDGSFIIPCEYSVACHYRAADLYAVRQNDKYGLLDAHGKMLIPLIYDSLSIGDKGLNEIAVSKDGCCYFINAKQEVVDVF